MKFSAFWNGIRGLKSGKGAAGKYTNLVLDDDAIARGDYKGHLGGGRETWDSRGLFQLELLRSRGLTPSSRLLDIGCGPLRAGLHFIRFLEPGKYFGFDYNSSFITTAQRVIDQNGLRDKEPSVAAIADFDLSSVDRQFDYAIAFSVLNHCTEAQRRLFVSNIWKCLAPGAKLYITHARWLKDADLAPAQLRILSRFDVQDVDLGKYGWPPTEQRSVCPIYELQRQTD